MGEIERLEREKQALELKYTQTTKETYSKLNKKIELETFFIECLGACEKEILKTHELQQLGQHEVTSSFFFELRRKKFLESSAAIPHTNGSMEPNNSKYETHVLD